MVKLMALVKGRFVWAIASLHGVGIAQTNSAPSGFTEVTRKIMERSDSNNSINYINICVHCNNIILCSRTVMNRDFSR